MAAAMGSRLFAPNSLLLSAKGPVIKALRFVTSTTPASRSLARKAEKLRYSAI